MAYFLPSYFQKRLLRYALTRLDFIDSDEFDLDNLGVTWGQKTVLELKNVGIKVKRLTDILQLPPSVHLARASVRLLRLTLPADLHVSGIKVEVDGVEVVVGIRPDTTTATPPKSHAPGARAGPSIQVPPLARHDSHGAAGAALDGQYGPDLEQSHVILTSEDLAASFLEAEPARERNELQAALESQSQYLHDSVTSPAADGGDVGLGMPGGLSLPTFVANFLQGVADRLSGKATDINVVVEMDPSASPAPLSERPKFMLAIADAALEPLDRAETPGSETDTRRIIEVNKIQVFILSDAETFPDSSGFNSPQSIRSRLQSAKTDTDRFHDDGAGSSSASLRPAADQSHLVSNSLSNSGLGIGLGSALSASEVSTEPSRSEHQVLPNESTWIDNRAHAEQMLLQSATHASVNEPRLARSSSQRLAESTVFTHDEAESMYMSAVSERIEMPGAWTATDDIESDPESDPPLHQSSSNLSERTPTDDPHEIPSSPIDHPPSPEGPSPDHSPDIPGSETEARHAPEPYFRTCVLQINHVNVKIPQERASEQMEGVRAFPHSSQAIQSASTSSGQPAPGRPSASSFLNEARTRLLAPTTPKEHRTEHLQLTIGAVTVNVDISVSRTLVAAIQMLLRAVPVQVRGTDPPKRTTTPLPKGVPPEVTIQEVNFNVFETIPRFASARTTAQEMESILTPSAPLLQLHCTAITLASVPGLDNARRFSISRIVMSHGAREVLSFVDSIKVRDSIASSSILRPHDFVATVTGNRYDVQIKPAHVILDLLVIDDVLGRSGGLSSLLDLGNSLISTSTGKGPLAVAPAEAVKARTVRFSDPDKARHIGPGSGAMLPKVDMRISGTIVDLIGSQSTVQIKTSAVKAVYRDNNVRLVVDGAAIEGPLFAGSAGRGDVSAKIRNIDIYYSNFPAEQDLDRLLSLITPSNNRFDQDDDIMVDTLLRQRRKGGVLRVNIGQLQAGADGVDWLPHIAKIGDEVAKLSSVTKYLPEDDRPGILTFGLVNKIELRLNLDETFGPVRLDADLIEAAHITLPSLVAIQIGTWALARSDNDVLIGEVISQEQTVIGTPMFMGRFIADEMEPTVRMKVYNTCIEYKVATVTAIASLWDRLQANQVLTKSTSSSQPSSPTSSHSGEVNSLLARKIRFSLTFDDSAIALNPDNSPSKGIFLLTDAVLRHENKKREAVENLEIKKATFLVIDDFTTVGQDSGNVDHKLYFEEKDQVQHLTKAGFVPVGSMSSASAVVRMIEDKMTRRSQLDVEFRNNLLFLETCADSTQTMIQILSELAPPAPPSNVAQYRTEIVPIQDLLASFTGNAFVSEPGPELGLEASRSTITPGSPSEHREYPDNDGGEDDDEFMTHLYPDVDETDEANDAMTTSRAESDLGASSLSQSIHVAPVAAMGSAESNMGDSVMMHSLLNFRSDHFAPKTSVGGTAHRWNSTQNTYVLASDSILDQSPIHVRIRDVHIIWNLFDGYDWQSTRDKISHAVKDIETKALARRPRSGSRIASGDDDEESVIGDFLFNSIYIGVPANKDPRDLANAINHDIDDMASETGSYATGTTVTATGSRRASVPVPRGQKLKLSRSKHHKITFELEGISADFVAFPPGTGEVQSSVDVRVRKLEIFDHIPTSTWKKFATYMQDAGERETGTSMVHIELLNVKPVADLSASEMVLKVSVLPLRLHVDQDALDFMTRFFEFKDDNATPSAPSSPPFLQRVEVNAIPVKLDFKPKRVDYAALRSGRTTEYMNFFILDRADMVLRRVILYGVSGFDRLGVMLNSIWMPDVRRNQLPGVLAGLAPIRSLVDVGSGVRDLVAVPIREYRKDGRIVRSVQKGALAFAKTTATELINLGAKMAIGTQQVLQTTEGLLAPSDQPEAVSSHDEAVKQISLYADQPIGIKQGLRSAYASLERDLLIAKDAIVAVPGEVMASGSARDAAKAVLKQSPTIILRPAIGATKAIGQTLMGAGNTLDKQNLRRVDEKYKRI